VPAAAPADAAPSVSTSANAAPSVSAGSRRVGTPVPTRTPDQPAPKPGQTQ
jgi:hypothetical protein